MSAGILLALAAGGGLAYLMKKRSDATTPNKETGIIPGVGPAATVQGKSGRPWVTQLVKIPSSSTGESQTQVVALPLATEPFQQHMVLVFSQRGSDQGTRKFVMSGPTTPALLNAAMLDFAVGPRA